MINMEIMSAEMITVISPAIVAGLMIAITHAPLGIEVLKRGIIFIDLAVAQIAGLGLVAAGLWLHDAPFWVLQIIALSCAIIAGLFFRKVESALPEQQEAIIGVSFVLAASLAILLLADHPHGGEEIQHLLSGQILFVTWAEVASHAPIYGFILLAWFAKPQLRSGIGFYVLFSMAVTSSVQLVGVYVVFSSLILPALACLQAARPIISAWGCGIFAVLTGILTATLLDLPAGPVIVCGYVVVAILMVLIMRIYSQKTA